MKQQNIVAILSMTEMFENLTPNQLEMIGSIADSVNLAKGQTLFEENESSDELYVITRGAVEILVNPGLVGLAQGLPPVRVTELYQGQVLGEVALVDQGLRSATARASQDRTELMVMPRERLMLLCDTYPELGYKIMHNLAADLALKMRNTDLTVRQMQLNLAKMQSSISDSDVA